MSFCLLLFVALFAPAESLADNLSAFSADSLYTLGSNASQAASDSKEAYFCTVSVVVVVALLLFWVYSLYRVNRQKTLRLKTLETERALLRHQMNPQLVFNTLNYIQNSISDNELENAESSLTNFTKLLRLNFDNSRKQQVLLSVDLLALSLYLDLERVRYGNKFNYKININGTVDDEKLFVPPMLIQPFVENAVLYGLAHKNSSDGFITININDRNDEQTIECEIIDNGIGRKAAAEYNKGKIGRNSAILKLTHERLQEVNHAKRDACYSITDLVDDNSNPMGTRVAIIIPYSEDAK